MMKTWMCAVGVLLCSSQAYARCVVQAPAEHEGTRHDLVNHLLQGADPCPTDAVALRAAWRQAGYELLPTMVANRGYHSPHEGSFSFFEMVRGAGRHGDAARGEVFFGHFTEVQNSQLVLAQLPDDGALLVELLAWDDAKGLYNFYELRGNGVDGVWFYRGDSADIAADTQTLFRQSPPVFGTRLRCSGCHLNGGPIMKELAAPHNDWWRGDRPLPLGHPPDETVQGLLRDLRDASVLSDAVQEGMAKLQARHALDAWYKAHWQQALRPLFCPHEVNFASDGAPAGDAARVSVPAAFAIDPRLATATLDVSAAAYQAALAALGMRFDDTSLTDADHGFLTPVRASSDAAMLEPWLANGSIDAELVDDVLAIDMRQPFASRQRCALLATVPEQWSSEWQAEWLQRLRGASEDGPHAAAAAELLANRSDPRRNSAWHRERAASLLRACQERLRTADGAALVPYIRLLAQRRVEIAASDISKNPLGQIMEPGFRVIFPTPAVDVPVAAWELDANCAVQPLGGRRAPHHPENR